jgi:hypothetical protein
MSVGEVDEEMEEAEEEAELRWCQDFHGSSTEQQQSKTVKQS